MEGLGVLNRKNVPDLLLNTKKGRGGGGVNVCETAQQTLLWLMIQTNGGVGVRVGLKTIAYLFILGQRDSKRKRVEKKKKGGIPC